jgi:predicted transposase/invertase (TIGR01784 family)
LRRRWRSGLRSLTSKTGDRKPKRPVRVRRRADPAPAYWAKLHQQQLHEGHDYVELKPTISVSFLDHVLFPKVPAYHLRFRLLETSQHFPLTDDLEFHLLELPKFTKSAEELSSDLDKWLYFLRHAEKMDTEAVPAALQQQPMVLRALEELKMLAQTDAERERYEARRKALLDYNTAMKVARMEGREEGRSEGREEGRNQGRSEGREEGRNQGRTEGAIERIHLCERLLNRTRTPTEELASRSLEDLIQLADALQAQVFRT